MPDSIRGAPAIPQPSPLTALLRTQPAQPRQCKAINQLSQERHPPRKNPDVMSIFDHFSVSSPSIPLLLSISFLFCSQHRHPPKHFGLPMIEMPIPVTYIILPRRGGRGNGRGGRKQKATRQRGEEKINQTQPKQNKSIMALPFLPNSQRQMQISRSQLLRGDDQCPHCR